MMFKVQSTPFCMVGPLRARPLLRPTRLANSSATPYPLVDRPPEDLTYYEVARKNTFKFVQSNYPQLLDLVENRSLMVVHRPEDYVERRADGYMEPKVIFLLGTSHMSLQSASGAERVIEAVHPENVVVEVCRSRLALIYDTGQENEVGAGRKKAWNPLNLRQPRQNEPINSIRSGPNFSASVGRSLQLGGRSALLLRLLLSQQAGRVANKLGVDSGADMRAARRAAELVGAQVVLGDRPIEITLQRAWDALSWPRRFQLAKDLVKGSLSPGMSELDAALVEQLRQDSDFIGAAIESLSKSYPEVASPLIHERDLYLAWSLKRSKAVNGTDNVVGVVGAGHMQGVVYHLIATNSNLRFKDLVGRKDSGQSPEMFLRNLVVELSVGTALWFAWTHFHP